MSKRRLVLCMGTNCNAGGRAAPLYDALVAALGEPCPAFMARGPVHWEVASCLDHCERGPNLVIYPAARWYHTLDRTALQDVLASLLGAAES